MEEAPENGKESSRSARTSGMNSVYIGLPKISQEWHVVHLSATEWHSIVESV